MATFGFAWLTEATLFEKTPSDLTGSCANVYFAVPVFVLHEMVSRALLRGATVGGLARRAGSVCGNAARRD